MGGQKHEIAASNIHISEGSKMKLLIYRIFVLLVAVVTLPIYAAVGAFEHSRDWYYEVKDVWSHPENSRFHKFFW